MERRWAATGASVCMYVCMYVCICVCVFERERESVCLKNVFSYDDATLMNSDRYLRVYVCMRARERETLCVRACVRG